MKRIDVTEQASVLAEEDAVTVLHDGGAIALCRTTDGLFAVDGICPHATANLADGYVLDQYIECPLHQALFDLTTGKRVSGPDCANLTCFDISQEGERVLIQIPI